MTAIRIENLSKSYGGPIVVDDVSVSIASGELFFLLGPSGCGKSTLLRAIAGFVKPEKGSITFDGRPIIDVAPKDRGTGMVFQNYALWPHMTVVQNIAFGLDVRNVRRVERDRRVAEAIELVRLGGLEQSRPTQLSGGQQQRVALARALVVRPAVLLLDEPLSNLDARLRTEMREEIRRIHDQTRLTTIYVTHDQKEALSLADRMAVMHNGSVVQIGPPNELYLKPTNTFVARFLGETNLIDGRVRSVQSQNVVVSTALGDWHGVSPNDELRVDDHVACSIRPESIRIGPSGSDGNRFRARVTRELFFGEVRHLEVRAGESDLIIYRLQPAAAIGGEIDCQVSASDVIVLRARPSTEPHS